MQSSRMCGRWPDDQRLAILKAQAWELWLVRSLPYRERNELAQVEDDDHHRQRQHDGPEADDGQRAKQEDEQATGEGHGCWRVYTCETCTQMQAGEGALK